MGNLAHAPVFRNVDVETAPPNVRISIRGLPEDVQWIADALEAALPGVIDWQSFAEMGASCLIEVNGVGYKFGNTSNVELS